jgi:hypothetical protein
MPIDSDRGGAVDIQNLLKDKDDFAAQLAKTYETTEIVRLLAAMNLRPSDLALGLNVHPRTIKAWLDESDPRTAERQRDEILALKSIVLFLLRRGNLSPASLAVWLVEPNGDLDFRRPLAVLGEGDTQKSLIRVMQASAPFVHPDEGHGSAPYDDSVAAGAAGRKPSPSDREEGGARGEADDETAETVAEGI